VYAIVREACRFLRPGAPILPSRLTETIGSQCEECHGDAAADTPRSSVAGVPALLRSLSAEEARRRLAAERAARAEEARQAQIAAELAETRRQLAAADWRGK
jgi:cytochrome c553